MSGSLLFCGTYTSLEGSTGSKGIYVYRRDQDTGKLSELASADLPNPTFLVTSADERHLFAISEISEFGGRASGCATSFAIDEKTGELAQLSQVSTEGTRPCHLALAPDGRSLLVSNYGSGSTAVLPVATDGRLSQPIQLLDSEPVDAREPHAHFATYDPCGQFVLTNDTGTDRVSIYRPNLANGALVAHEPKWAETHYLGSPRHLAFSRGGGHVLVNGETDLTITLFRYDNVAGRLTQVGYLSTLLEGTPRAGASTAQVLVHPGGKFVYVSNRGPNTIATFAFDEAAEKLELIDLAPSRGRTPRNFQFAASGRQMYVANQDTDTIELFAVDADSGRLLHMMQVATVPRPTCVHCTASA